MKIRGNTVGTTMPRPDWNQTDPTKADYILNKPDLSNAGGLTAEQIAALDGMFKIAAYTANASAAYAIFRAAFGIGGSSDEPVIPDEPDVPEDETAELNTDGLDGFFDLRNVTGNSVSGGGGSIHATIGDGMIWNWVSPLFSSTGDEGSILSRIGWYSADKSAAQTEMGTAFTAIAAGYAKTNKNIPCVQGFTYSNLSGVMAAPSYVNADGETITLSQVQFAGTDEVTEGAYCTTAITVDGNILKYYFNGVLKLTFDGADYDGFSYWTDKTGIYGSTNINSITSTAFAVYSRALSDVEMVEMNEYLKTLGVA